MELLSNYAVVRPRIPAGIAALLMVVLGLWFSYQPARADITPVSASVTGGSPIEFYRTPFQNVTVQVTVNRTGSGTANDWQGTNYRWNASDTYTCYDTTDYTSGTGNSSATLTLTAPDTPGVYTLELQPRQNNDCTGAGSATTTASVTVSDATVTDPNLYRSCGLNIILVLDESGSISTAGATGYVRAATSAFLAALSDTTSRVAIVEFNTHARAVVPYTVVTGGTLATVFTPYINATSSGEGYNPAGYPSNDRGTNWDDALQKAADLISGATAPIVVFMTDGTPTFYNLDKSGDPPTTGPYNIPGIGGPGNSTDLTTINRAVEAADIIKAQGIHILGVGTGPTMTAASSQTRLKAISGFDVYAGSGELDLYRIDAIQAVDFTLLEREIRRIGISICRPALAVTKKVDENGGAGPQLRAGWAFTGTVNVTQSGQSASNYEWLSPVQGLAGAPTNLGLVQPGVSDANGMLLWHWATQRANNRLPWSSQIVVTEGNSAGYALRQANCERRTLFADGSASTTHFTLSSFPATVALGSGDVIVCEVVNEKANVDLETVKTGPATISSGSSFTYSLEVTNHGTQIATGVVLTDNLTANLAYVTAGSDPRCSAAADPAEPTAYGGQIVTCNLGSISPAATTRFVIKVQHNPASHTNFQNTACTRADQVDSNSANNCSSIQTGSTPVTVSYFHAKADGDGIQFEWATATETNNAGFHLYVDGPAGRVRLNDELIPSAVVNAATPQEYRYRALATQAAGASGPAGEARFYIEDVDIFTNATLHGPFALDQQYGSREQPTPIDWAAITAEHNAKLQLRRAADTAAVNAFLVANAGAAAGAMTNGAADAGPFEDQADFVEVEPGDPNGRLLLPLLANAGQHAADVPEAAAAPATNPKIQVLVNQTGIHRITAAQLAAAGFNLVGVPARDLALTQNGVPVPLRVYSRERFGPNAFVEFYGQALDTLYTNTNVYLLQLDRSKARRPGVKPSAPPTGSEPVPYYLETATVERNQGYNFLAPNQDPWYDTLLFVRGHPGAWSFDVDVDHYLPGAAPATLRLELWGAGDWPAFDPDFHVVAGFNATANLADLNFSGLSLKTPTLTLPESVLTEGRNQLNLNMPSDTGVPWEMVYLDNFSVMYPRAFAARNGMLAFTAAGALFRVTELTSPEVVVYRIAGARLILHKGVRVRDEGGGHYSATFAGTPNQERYLVYSGNALLTPALLPLRPAVDITSGRADYLMLSHADFIPGLAPLVDFHRARGLNVKVVDANDVYAQFGSGVFDAEALHRYIAYAIQKLGVRYILLVGGDTYDYRRYMSNGGFSFIPSLYAATGPDAQFAPVDPLYTDVDGDRVPDAAIGRFPVRTDAELATLIQKTLAYANKDYAHTAVYAADMEFADDSEAIRLAATPGWATQTAYLDEVDVATARTRLLGSLNGGVALASYAGHSGPSVWSYRGLFNAADAAGLSNTGKPTVVAQWGCWNTYYVDPAYQTLAHRFLVEGDRGAAVVLGSTGVSYEASERALGVVLMPRLVEPGVTTGTALLAAKRALAAEHPEMVDVILGWTQLGDPALQINP